MAANQTTGPIRRVGLVVILLGLILPIAAQNPSVNAKELRGVASEDFAIAQFIDGRFVIVTMAGQVQTFDLRPAFFFTLARFSQDGKRIASLSGDILTVLNQKFEHLWSQRIRTRNIFSLALSPDGQKVIVAARDRQTHSVQLVIIDSTGVEETLKTVPQTATDESWIMSWNPTNQRVVYSIQGQVYILDLQTRATQMIVNGYDPAWSPDGKWIAYRSSGGQLAIFDTAQRLDKSIGFRPKISSTAHWSPDSKSIFVDEEYLTRKPGRSCFTDSRFVVYRFSDEARKLVYDPCGLKDENFAWISDPKLWVAAATKRQGEKP